jgi:hypothetical protein
LNTGSISQEIQRLAERNPLVCGNITHWKLWFSCPAPLLLLQSQNGLSVPLDLLIHRVPILLGQVLWNCLSSVAVQEPKFPHPPTPKVQVIRARPHLRATEGVHSHCAPDTSLHFRERTWVVWTLVCGDAAPKSDIELLERTTNLNCLQADRQVAQWSFRWTISTYIRSSPEKSDIFSHTTLLEKQIRA